MSGPTRTKFLQKNSDYVNVYATVAKLYVAFPDQGTWTEHGSGVLQIGTVPNSKLVYINMYDLQNYKLIFQQELYENFFNSYKVVDKQFHVFQSDACVIGLSFPFVDEAKDFHSQIKGVSPKKKGLFSKMFAKDDDQMIITTPEACQHVSGVQQNNDASLSLTGNFKDNPDFNAFLEKMGISLSQLSDPSQYPPGG